MTHNIQRAIMCQLTLGTEMQIVSCVFRRYWYSAPYLNASSTWGPIAPAGQRHSWYDAEPTKIPLQNNEKLQEWGVEDFEVIDFFGAVQTSFIQSSRHLSKGYSVGDVLWPFPRASSSAVPLDLRRITVRTLFFFCHTSLACWFVPFHHRGCQQWTKRCRRTGASQEENQKFAYFLASF